MGRREEIAEALELMIRRERGKEFECLGFQVARGKWPQLVATAYRNDRGEDAVSLSGIDPSGRRRSVACSLTTTLTKVKGDCSSIHGARQQIDVLVFVTAGEVTNARRQKWAQEVKDEFGHDLELVDREALLGELERPENEWLCSEYLYIGFKEGEPPDVYGAAKAAAEEIVEGWRRETGLTGWPVIPLGLTLTTSGQGAQRLLSIDEAIEEIMLRRTAIILGSAGAGKSAAMVRLAGRLLSLANAPLPLLVKLSDVTRRGSRLLEDVADTVPFKARGLTTAKLAALTSEGHLLFLLDGWNEVETQRRSAAEALVASVLREAPATILVASGREGDPPPPHLFSATLGVPAVTVDFRANYLADVGASASLVSQLESDPTLRRLARIPLFLRIATEIGLGGGDLPRSRYELLKAFVDHVEQIHWQGLRESSCRGHHRLYLERLAAEMCERGTSSLAPDDALAATAAVGGLLVARGLVPEAPPALDVLETLVRHHLLVGESTFRFQHQEFQQLFAADEVCSKAMSLMRSGEMEGWNRWVPTLLNGLVWEETLMLVMDRLRSEEGPVWEQVATALVRSALQIDPVLTARLSRFLNNRVWAICGGSISGALRGLWSSAGPAKELGFLAILATGRSDFADVVLPVVQATSGRFYQHLRTTDASGLWCLGHDWRQVFRSLPPDRREDLLFALARAGEPESIDLLLQLVSTDPAPRVRLAARIALAFFGLQHHAAAGLGFVSPSDWDSRDSLTLIDLLGDTVIAQHSLDLRQLVPSLDERSRRGVLRRLVQAGTEGLGELLRAELNSCGRDETRLQLLSDLQRQDPKGAVEWLFEAMLRGECWHESFGQYLQSIENDGAERLGDLILDGDLPTEVLRGRLEVLCVVAPGVAACRIATETLLSTAGGQASAEERRGVLTSAFRQLEFECRARAVVNHYQSCSADHLLRELPRLLGPSSPFEPREKHIDADLQERLRDLALSLDTAAQARLPEEPWLRASLAALLGVAGKPEDAGTLERWIRDAEADEAWKIAAGKRPMTDESHWYAGALARLGGAQAFAALLRLVQDPAYLGAASMALSRMVANSTPDCEATWREQARTTIRTAFALSIEHKERGHPGKPYPFGLGEAAGAMADLGDLDSAGLVLRMTALKYCDWEGIRALEQLVVAGVTLPGEETARALDPTIARAAAGARTSDQDPWWLGVRAIKLLLASDQPVLGVDRARLHWAGISRSTTVQGVLQALAIRGKGVAEAFLLELSHATNGSEWWIQDLALALAAVLSTGRVRLLTELWLTRVAPGPQHANASGAFAEAVAVAARSDPSEFAELSELAGQESGGLVRDLAARVLARVGTAEAAMVACQLIDDNLSPSLPASAHRLILDQFSVVEASTPYGWSEVHPRASNVFRANLLKLAAADKRRNRTARELLLELEVRRAEEGRPIDEPRHPDVSGWVDSETAWYL